MPDFDYLIVGAGTAGCVLANRLTANGRFSVLLIEAGGSDRSLWISVPIGYGRTFTDPRFNWMYEAEPDPTLANRVAFWPRGKVLGGSSSINAMVYVRGQPADFDEWRTAGNAGWGWSEVLPYFRKLEDHAAGASEFHGAGGPVQVSDVSGGAHPLCETFIATCAGLGYPRTLDFNGSVTEGAGLWHVTVRNGRRVSAATAYLRPAAPRPNLTVRTRARAVRILFQGLRATGIEYLADGKRTQAHARREVILSAGAINSPQLLELSGIGEAGLLQRHGIALVADAPAVGNGLQDHLAVSYFYKSKVPTLNDELAPLAGKIRAALRYGLSRTGPLAMSVNQAGAFLRGRAGLQRPNLHIYFNPASYATTLVGTGRRLLNPDPYSAFLMSFNSCRPMSRGSIHIRSADPLAPPAIVPNGLTSAQDIAEVYEGAALLRRIASAPPLSDVIESELTPGAAVTRDEQVLEDFRLRAGSVFHACSTCAMGVDPRRSVVTPRLAVHGVRALRVVDASVFPTVTSGNTNTPTLMVAEKAAELILQDAPNAAE